MKVLVASEPGVDGVFRYVEGLCHFLVDKGITVNLAYSDRRGSDALIKLADFIETCGGRAINFRVSNTPSLRDWSALWSLRKMVKETKPDLIHSHSSKAGVLARSLSLLGIKAAQFYTPHAYYGQRPGGGILQPIYNLAETAFGRLSHTIASSKAEQSFAISFLRIPSSRVSQVYNGVDTDVFCPASAEEKRCRRAELGLPQEGRILGFLGRSSVQKDPMTLYEAFASIADQQSDLSLFHVGSGDLDRDLERFIDSRSLRSRILRCSYMAVPRHFYRCIDAFALPSRYEGFSIAALEAMSCNLPLILSRAPGNTDLFSFPLSHVWSAKPGHVDGFAAAISVWSRLAPQPSEINHRETALANFSSRQQFESVLQLYQKMVGPSIAKQTELQCASQ